MEKMPVSSITCRVPAFDLDGIGQAFFQARQASDIGGVDESNAIESEAIYTIWSL